MCRYLIEVDPSSFDELSRWEICQYVCLFVRVSICQSVGQWMHCFISLLRVQLCLLALHLSLRMFSHAVLRSLHFPYSRMRMNAILRYLYNCFISDCISSYCSMPSAVILFSAMLCYDVWRFATLYYYNSSSNRII